MDLLRQPRSNPFVALLAVTHVLVAAIGPLRAASYHVHTYTENDGLPSTSVWSVVQTDDGRMWFATRMGIAIYDGRDWSEQGLEDGLTTLNLRLLKLEAGGRMWALSAAPDTRIYKLERGADRWDVLDPAPPAFRENTTAAIPVGDGSDGRLLIGSTPGLAYWDGTTWTEIESESGERPWIYGFESYESRVFAATDLGLFEVWLDGTDLVLSPVEEGPDLDVRGLAADPARGRLWLVGAGWIGFWDGEGFSKLPHDFDRRTAREGEPMQILVDDRGDVVFGAFTLLFRLDPEGDIEQLGMASGLVSEGAHDLFVDREGLLWVSSARGVSKIVSQRFASFTQRDALLEDEVSAVLERADGSIVLGHSSGLTFFETRKTIRLGDPLWARVLDLDEDSRGRLWVAAYRHGLYRIDPSGEMTRYRAREEWSGRVNTVLVDGDDRVWIGTNGGLFRKEGEDFIAEPIPDWVRRTAVRRLFLGHDERIYLGAISMGLWGYEDGTWTRWAVPGVTDANNVYAFLDRPDGSPWVGTTTGLATTEGDTLVPVETPAIDRPIYFMLEDREGRVWFGTDNGVLVWDGERVRHLSVKHGLAGRETNRAAGLLDSKGRIWIGTDGGLSVYRPEFDLREHPAPSVNLEGVEVAGELRSLTEKTRLGSSQNALTFRYHVVSFADEREIRVRTRLVGLRDEWSSPERPTLWASHFSYLPPGTYRFEIQASNVDGRWSAVASSAPIVIAPPIWARWWFFAGLFAVVAAVAYAIHRASIRHRLRVQREANNAQKLESLGFLAGGVAHDFNNLLMVLLGNLHLVRQETDARERDRTLETLEKACLQARDLTGQLLTFSRGGAPTKETGRLDGVIRDCVTFALSGANVSYEMDLAPDLWAVDFDAGQMSQVINNVLINAVQAMPDGGSVRVRAQNLSNGDARGVELQIQDSGCGIPEDKIDHVFDPYFSTKDDGQGLGLATAHSIVRRHDGELTVTSVTGQGTTFTIRLPASDGEPKGPGIAGPTRPARSARVLVVDDDEDVRATIRAMLQSLDYEVACAVEGGAAIEMYTKAIDAGARFDAVILDLTIRGGMGGRETVTRLLEIDPDVGAIVASGYSSDPVMANFEQYGFRARIGKPFLRHDLEEAVQQVLDR